MNTTRRNLQMNHKPEPASITKEELATWPSEPYTLDVSSISWN